MIRAFLLTLVAAAVVVSHSDAHAMSGGKGKHRGNGQRSDGVVTFSHREESSSPVSSSVPEAGTVVLLVSGAAGLAIWRLWRK
jgi:hypothetical protein